MALMVVRRCLVTFDMNGARLIATASSESVDPEIFSMFDQNCEDETRLADLFNTWLRTLGGYAVWMKVDGEREVRFIKTHFDAKVVLGFYTLFYSLPFR